jgi:hypothetical protein
VDILLALQVLLLAMVLLDLLLKVVLRQHRSHRMAMATLEVQLDYSGH